MSDHPWLADPATGRAALADGFGPGPGGTWELDSSHRLPAEQRRGPEDFTCPSCGAAPGAPCKRATLGRHAQPYGRAELARVNNNRRYTDQPDYEEPSR